MDTLPKDTFWMPSSSTFHERLARAVEAAGYRRTKPGRAAKGEKTQRQLADKVGMTQSELSRWMSGERGGLDRTTEQIFKLSRELGVSLDYLLGGEEAEGCLRAMLAANAERLDRLEDQLRELTGGPESAPVPTDRFGGRVTR